MTNTILTQMANTVEIIGTLKQNNLVQKVSAAKNDMMTGDVVVMVKDGDKVNEFKIKAFAVNKNPEKPNKVYLGLQTVAKEYVAGQKISIRGELIINRYNGKEWNEIKGVFFNRVEDETIQDKALATVDVHVEGYQPVLGPDQLPTGEQKVNCFTIGYGPSIIPLKNAIISQGLFTSFQSLYFPGTTGSLTFKLNNYAEVKENVVEEAATTHGFGVSTKVEDGYSPKNYFSNYEIIGGDIPFSDARALQPFQIEEAIKLLKVEESSNNSVPTAPPTGFGTNAASAPIVNPTVAVMQDENLPF